MPTRLTTALATLAAATTLITLPTAAAAQAQQPPTSAAATATAPSPQALIQRLAADVLTTVKNDPTMRSGDIAHISALVDNTVMPHVNFRRMTSAAVGPQWRQATPQEREQLQQHFKALLIRTYAGALAQVTDQEVILKPTRAAATDTDVLIRTEITGKGDPVPLDFRLEQQQNGEWKIYNLNILGMWIVETYRSQFAPEINKGGIPGLLQTLATLNHTASARP